MKKILEFFSRKSLILSLSLLVFPALIAEQGVAKKVRNAVFANVLKKFKVSNEPIGSFCFDPNGAFFVDNQDPKIRIYYKNEKGETKTRLYQASIDSVGLKIALTLNFNLVFFTGNLDYMNTNKTLHLGNGFSTGAPGFILAFILETLGLIHVDLRNHNPLHNLIPMLEFTYCSLENAPGSLIIVSAQTPNLVNFNIASVITGGTLTPIDFD